MSFLASNTGEEPAGQVVASWRVTLASLHLRPTVPSDRKTVDHLRTVMRRAGDGGHPTNDRTDGKGSETQQVAKEAGQSWVIELHAAERATLWKRPTWNPENHGVVEENSLPVPFSGSMWVFSRVLFD